MAASNRMASFLATLQWEGGGKLSLNRADAGNWTGGRVGVGVLLGTKYGVSAAAHPGLDIPNITQEQACQIFVDGYWHPVNGDNLAVGLDHCVSDDAWNAGAANALKLYTRAGLTNKSDPSSAIKSFSALRLSFLRALTSWKTFGVGWARRVGGVEAESLRMLMTATSVPPARQDEVIKDHASDVKASSAGQASGAVVAGATAPAAHIAAGPHWWPEAIVGVLVIIAIGFVISAVLQHQRATGIAAPPKGTAS